MAASFGGPTTARGVVGEGLWMEQLAVRAVDGWWPGWSRQARPAWVGTGAWPAVGLDKLDQRRPGWSRQARPAAARLVSTGSTSGGPVGLDRLDQRGLDGWLACGWSRQARPA